jgi:type I restriction enzyme S subunit
MQCYQSYKPSGIQWVEKIPSHWGAERAKWLFNRMERPVRPEDDVVTAFRDGQVTLRTNRRTEGFTNAIQEHGYQGIRKGDLVIHAMDAFAGAIGVSDSDGKSTPVYAACVPRGEYPVNSYYYAYLLRYMAHSGYIESLSKGIRERSTDFRFAEFRELPLPIPDKDEQDRIVAFLDQKTAEIDAAIAKKEQLIELLGLQKDIQIDLAITCGLEPDVPLKDNDLLYAKKMPEHWVIKKVKHVSLISPSKTLDGRRRTSESVCFLPMEKIGDDGTINSGDRKPANEVFDGFTYFRKGDVVIAKITPCFENGKGAWLNELPTDYGFGTTELHVLRPTKIHGEFLFRLLNRKDFLAQGEQFMVGSAGQKRVPTSFIANYLFACPPVEEQREICAWISDLCTRTESLIRTESEAISHLRELKQVLIASAVTGRIRVNGN